MTSAEIDELRAGDSLFEVEESTSPDGTAAWQVQEYRMRSPQVTKHQKTRHAGTIRIEVYRSEQGGAARGRIRCASAPLLQLRFERTAQAAIREFRARTEREVERLEATLKRRKRDAEVAIAWADAQAEVRA